MKERRVRFSPEAKEDLERLYDWIAAAAGPGVAIGYLGRIEKFCLGMRTASERGHKRDDIRPGLRIVGMEERITIAFAVFESHVTILRVLYGGQNWEPLLKQ